MLNPKWLDLAIGEKGVKELDGSLSNPRILEYFNYTTLRAVADEVPWCSAFVNWCLEKSDIKGTNSAASRSFLSWGNVIKEPRLGAIVILKRGNNTYKGHVGFIHSVPPFYSPFIDVLGGNQSNQVCVKKYLKNDVLGYRWPVGY
jgi:uncharacterized protein (TIGR02594 family)